MATFEDAKQILVNEIPFIEFTVDHTAIIESVASLLLEVFPDSVNPTFEQFTDGITNKLIKCTFESRNELQCFLVRAYGKKTEILINREQEFLNAICLHKRGLGPHILCRFTNGFIYVYIEGQPYTLIDLQDPSSSFPVAKKMAEWHMSKFSANPTPSLFVNLWKWMNAIPEKYENTKTQDKFQIHIDIGSLATHLRALESKLKKLNSPVVFCHNDLLSGNIIRTTEGIAFIDFEYASYNYRGFDIANHFCEYAGFQCDYSKFPSERDQRLWLLEYTSSIGRNEDIDKIFREVEFFTLASHFFWGLWGLLQAQNSDIDFNYMDYAIKRFQIFFKSYAALEDKNERGK